MYQESIYHLAFASSSTVKLPFLSLRFSMSSEIVYLRAVERSQCSCFQSYCDKTYKALWRKIEETAANNTSCVLSRFSFKGTLNAPPLKRRTVSCFCLRTGSCLEVRCRIGISHFYSDDQSYCSLAFDLCGYVRQNSHWLPIYLTTRYTVPYACVTHGPQGPPGRREIASVLPLMS